jgi:glycosyltransferase involved in cell wall biosynthesis
MLVSIITICYNRQDTISKTIESVLNQDYPNIEYIIIDGNSNDGTTEIMAIDTAPLVAINDVRKAVKFIMKIIKSLIKT